MFQMIDEPEDCELGIVKIAAEIVAVAVLGAVVFLVSALLAMGAVFVSFR
jgi:hypothetical protein